MTSEAKTTELICAREAHELFAQAFAVHGNAVAAFKVAYPEASPRTAKSNAHKVAARPDVQRRVAELQAARRKHLLEATADLDALVANLALGKAARLVDPETGEPIPLHRLPVEVRSGRVALSRHLAPAFCGFWGASRSQSHSGVPE